MTRESKLKVASFYIDVDAPERILCQQVIQGKFEQSLFRSVFRDHPYAREGNRINKPIGI